MITSFFKTTVFIHFTILILLIGTTHYLQRTHNSYFSHQAKIEELQYLPSGAFLKGAALSFDEILADMFWIKSIGYFGQQYKGEKTFQWLHQLLEVITSLDPPFEDPYEFGGIILGYEVNDLEHSFEILKKGMENVPKHHKRYWYLPFFTAFNYMYYKGDNQTAAQYLELAASFPQRPEYLPLLVARLYANTNDPGMAIPFLQKMIEQSASPEMKKKLEVRVKEIQVKQHILLLTAARDRYLVITGKNPQSLEEIVEQGIIPRIPQEPFGGQYFISKNDNTIHTNSGADDMELHINRPEGAPLIFQESK